ncbi:MAG: hypothetical protein QXW13_01480 [Nanopusillaceae archaeon]
MMELQYEIMFDYAKSIFNIFLIIFIGYVLGRIAKIIFKAFLSKVLGIDKWLEIKKIKIFYGNFSTVASNILKDFIYLIFFSYALIYSNIAPLVEVGQLALNIVVVLLILTTVLIIVHLFTKIFLDDLLSKITFLKEIEELRVPIYSIIYFISVIITLDYLGLLSKALLYIFLISFSGIVIFIAIFFGVAYGEKIKEKIKR